MARKKGRAADAPGHGAPAALVTAAERVGAEGHTVIVVVSSNQEFGEFFKAGKPWKGSGPKRVAIVWCVRPVDVNTVLRWRSSLVEEGEVVSRWLQPPGGSEPWNQQAWEKWLREQLRDWAVPPPSRPERMGLEVGECVRVGTGKAAADRAQGQDPALLVVSPSGRLAEVLAELDECKRAYRDAIGPRVGDRRNKVLAKLDALYAFTRHAGRSSKADGPTAREVSSQIEKALADNSFRIDPRRLPRILLLGPSGCGKTHAARYLAQRTSPGPGPDEPTTRPFKRVAVPEYLNKEDMFEYDVFGYTSGAYTGGREGGSRGFLAERMGGVIFFDEIGDSSAQIQAKLLAYLDDYQVTPRGWEGDPFFCPMLVVAATNRPITQWARSEEADDRSAGRFRNDLLRRFNWIITLPSLNERREEIPSIVDSLLQQEAFNPDRQIRFVGEDALRKITETDYSLGNFRTLEQLLRRACARAAADGRDYLVTTDLQPAS